MNQTELINQAQSIYQPGMNCRQLAVACGCSYHMARALMMQLARLETNEDSAINLTDQQPEERDEPQVPWDDIFSLFPTATRTEALVRRHKALWEQARLEEREMNEGEEAELNLLFTAIWPQCLNAAYEQREREMGGGTQETCKTKRAKRLRQTRNNVIFATLYIELALIPAVVVAATEQSIPQDTPLASIMFVITFAINVFGIGALWWLWCSYVRHTGEEIEIQEHTHE